jgi:tRNA pseudouridine38-40 synthase
VATNSQPAGSKKQWKITVAYDGTDFHGWQVQPDRPTIQGELQAALSRITGESPLPQGAGRTDAGVHALAQVASFALQAAIPEKNLVRALNRTLPTAIRILDAAIAPASFHARHSAVAKTYEYRILAAGAYGDRCSPFLAPYVYPCPWRLDFARLQDAAAAFVGEHDFVSFATTDPDLSVRNGVVESDTDSTGTIKTIWCSMWERRQSEGEDLLVYRVRGNSFLHHMVRNLVGTMIDVGRGYRKAQDMRAILAARSRSAAGPTAPARGLFLYSVEYLATTP